MRLTLSTPLYRWYTRILMAEVSARPMPQPVALILDGNRRFARQLGLEDVTEGHRYGAEKVKQLVQPADHKHPKLGVGTETGSRQMSAIERRRIRLGVGYRESRPANLAGQPSLDNLYIRLYRGSQGSIP